MLITFSHSLWEEVIYVGKLNFEDFESFFCYTATSVLFLFRNGNKVRPQIGLKHPLPHFAIRILNCLDMRIH